MKFVNWLTKALVWLLAHIFEGAVTVVASFTALASLFIFDSLILKIFGVVGSFFIAYISAYYFGKVRGEDKE